MARSFLGLPDLDLAAVPSPLATRRLSGAMMVEVERLPPICPGTGARTPSAASPRRCPGGTPTRAPSTRSRRRTGPASATGSGATSRPSRSAFRGSCAASRDLRRLNRPNAAALPRADRSGASRAGGAMEDRPGPRPSPTGRSDAELGRLRPPRPVGRGRPSRRDAPRGTPWRRRQLSSSSSPKGSPGLIGSVPAPGTSSRTRRCGVHGQGRQGGAISGPARRDWLKALSASSTT
jgi:hypothetical protein